MAWKLIKEYPNSPALGSISTIGSCEKFPEFWRLVSYKIVSILDGGITSVLRLSDNTLFSVGDRHTIKTGFKGTYYTIKDIIEYGDSILFLNKEFGGYISLENAVKISTPILTSSDGVELFTGDTAYFINEHNITKKPVVNARTVISKSQFHPDTKYYSCVEAAEKDMIFNYRCISYKDLCDIYTILPYSWKVTDLVKSRLNA